MTRQHDRSECVHRWRIAEPDGRKELPGTCTKCGSVREGFKASMEMWEGSWMREGDGNHRIFETTPKITG